MTRTQIKGVLTTCSPILDSKRLTDLEGNITVEEFGRVMKASGQNPTDEELQQIIKEVDLDGDGTINFDGMFYRRMDRAQQSLMKWC